MRPIKTALLIDDDETEHFFYDRIVAKSELVEDTKRFFYADEALEYLRATNCEEIDVIFLDINMPRMNGFEFLKAAADELGQNFLNIKVVMLTSSSAERDVSSAQSIQQITKYLHKPLEVEHLQDVARMINNCD